MTRLTPGAGGIRQREVPHNPDGFCRFRFLNAGDIGSRIPDVREERTPAVRKNPFYSSGSWGSGNGNRWTDVRLARRDGEPRGEQSADSLAGILEKIRSWHPLWCPGRESNPHDRSRGILSPLRLPISPPGRGLGKGTRK